MLAAPSWPNLVKAKDPMQEHNQDVELASLGLPDRVLRALLKQEVCSPQPGQALVWRPSPIYTLRQLSDHTGGSLTLESLQRLPYFGKILAEELFEGLSQAGLLR